MQADTVIDTQTTTRVDTDRLVYVVMAALFVVTAIVGFGPRSAGILAGTMPNPPFIVHVHAALMTGWLLLFLAQTVLMASANRALHVSLGVTAFALTPVMVAAMIAATVTVYGNMLAAGAGDMGSNILLLQIRSVILFPLFLGWALRTRRSDPQTHKRMMVLSTLILIDAAIARMNWLPGNDITVSYNMTFVYQFMLIAPALLYDKLRFGKVHHAYLIGIGLYLPWVLATSLLWHAPWWLAAAPKLMGY